MGLLTAERLSFAAKASGRGDGFCTVSATPGVRVGIGLGATGASPRGFDGAAKNLVEASRGILGVIPCGPTLGAGAVTCDRSRLLAFASPPKGASKKAPFT